MYKYFNSWGRYDNQICTLVAPLEVAAVVIVRSMCREYAKMRQVTFCFWNLRGRLCPDCAITKREQYMCGIWR